jgi:hypothetical protein
MLLQMTGQAFGLQQQLMMKPALRVNAPKRKRLECGRV